MKKYSRKYIGKKYKTNEGYTAIIVDGGSKEGYCTIQINDWVKEVSTSNLASGGIRYPYNPCVCGVGYYGVGKYKSRTNKQVTKAYKKWNSMLRRCYSQKAISYNPTYKAYKVCVSWLNYQVFAKWFEENYTDGWELDKDLLLNNSNVYSPKTCVFIPHCLNSFMANDKSDNRSGHVGGYWDKSRKKWRVRITDIDTHKRVGLGFYTDVEKASLAYQRARTTMAHRMKHKMILEYGITDLRILDAIDRL